MIPVFAQIFLFIRPTDMNEESRSKISVRLLTPSFYNLLTFLSYELSRLENSLRHDGSQDGKLQLKVHVWIQGSFLLGGQLVACMNVLYFN